MRQRILSRHRLPLPYRALLTALWITPQAIFIALAFARQSSAALLDPRLWLPLAIMAVPALYIWREGVDVLVDGIRTWAHVPRFHPYTSISAWQVECDARTPILIIRDKKRRAIFQSHAAHLTDFEGLVRGLDEHLTLCQRE